MEKIFRVPSDKQPGQSDSAPLAPGQVYLKNRHLIIEGTTAENVFGSEIQVYQVYYPQPGMLILAPMSDTTFRQAHECSLVMLKTKNIRGDKSLSLEEIIIDNDLNNEDRELVANGAPGLKMLQVMLS